MRESLGFSRLRSSKDRFDILRRKKLRRRYRPGIQARKAVHGGLIAVNRPEDPLQLWGRRLKRCEVAGEIIHRPNVSVADALVLAHGFLEWPRARQ
jgi:hypothetical protein